MYTIVFYFIWTAFAHAATPSNALRAQIDPARLTLEWTPEREAAAAKRLDQRQQPVLPGMAWGLLKPEEREAEALGIEINREIAAHLDPKLYTRPWLSSGALTRHETREIERAVDLFGPDLSMHLRHDLRERLTELARHLDVAPADAGCAMDVGAEVVGRLLWRVGRAKDREKHGRLDSAELDAALGAALFVIARAHLLAARHAEVVSVPVWNAIDRWARDRFVVGHYDKARFDTRVAAQFKSFWMTVFGHVVHDHHWTRFVENQDILMMLPNHVVQMSGERIGYVTSNYLRHFDARPTDVACADLLARAPSFDD